MGKIRRLPGPGATGFEWVGARVPAPMHVIEDEPYRPDIILWLELPDGFIVGTALTHPEKPDVSFGESLLAAMKSPMIGPPRRPGRIRVANESLASEVRAVVGDFVHLSIAPTPEIDGVVQEMARGFPVGDEPESYFEGGRVPLETVENLFRSARLLFGVAPWKIATDDQVLRLDIPQLGVQGACVSIIGQLGESFGVLIFPSLEGYYAFIERSDELESSNAPIDLGTTILSLNFENAADLPVPMRREAAEHGWPVAAPSAYPRVLHQDRDGMRRPLNERDVRIASACALSLTTFFVRNQRIFEDELPEPVSESYADGNELSVRFTAPYDAWSLFEGNEPPPAKASARRRVGRNEPCPCGSGKKYKKCHLGSDEQPEIADPSSESVHEMDRRLVAMMHRWATQRFRKEWQLPMKKLIEGADETELQLLVPWSVFHKAIDGRPVVAWFQDEMGSRLSDREHGWLAAQRRAWLTVWEVLEVEPGVELKLKDLLSGEIRRVVEVSGSKALVKRDAVLGRVVDYEGNSVICGMHPRMLPPWQAAECTRRIRSRLRRQTAVSPDRLRDEKLGRYMIRQWEELVDSLDLERSQPPRLSNTDGDPLLLTIDHFEFDLAEWQEVESKLATVEGIQLPDNDEETGTYRIVRPGNSIHPNWESTLIGVLRVGQGALKVETNSVRRADELRALVEKACQGRIRFQIREHCDPLSEKARAQIPQQRRAENPDPGLGRVASEFKARHYATWPDQPLPALGGKTPRQAAGTARGRSRLDVLLKDMENHECRLPTEERFDFGLLRASLGLDS